MAEVYLLRYIRIVLCILICLIILFGDPICNNFTNELDSNTNCSMPVIQPKCLTDNSTPIALDAYNREFMQCNKISFRHLYDSFSRHDGMTANDVYCAFVLCCMLQILIVMYGNLLPSRRSMPRFGWVAQLLAFVFEQVSLVAQIAGVVLYYFYAKESDSFGNRSAFLYGILALHFIGQLFFFLELFLWLFVRNHFELHVVLWRKYKYDVSKKERQFEEAQRRAEQQQRAKGADGEPQLMRVTLLEREMFSPPTVRPRDASSPSQSSC